MATSASCSAKVPRPPNFADFCRLCPTNLRVNGTLTNLRKIFDLPDPNPDPEKPVEKSIFERLAAVGVILRKRKDASERLCLKCHRYIKRVEDTLTRLQEWKDVDDRERQPTDPQKTPQRNEKRTREPTPSKTPRAVKKRLETTSKSPDPKPPKAPPKAPTQRTSETKVRVFLFLVWLCRPMHLKYIAKIM